MTNLQQKKKGKRKRKEKCLAVIKKNSQKTNKIVIILKEGFLFEYIGRLAFVNRSL
jgi:hypothetical protein